MFLCGFYNGMKVHECIGSEVRAEASGILQFDFQLPYAPFRSVVVRRDCRIFQEIKDVVATLEQPVLESGEFFVQFRQVLIDELVKPPKPWLRVNVFRRSLVTFMYGFQRGIPT